MNKLLAFTIIPFLAAGCSNPEPAPKAEMVSKNIELTMASHFGENFGDDTYKDSCLYSDYWFLNDSTSVNYELALMSSMTCGASYANSTDVDGSKITNFLKEAGYSKIEENKYFSENVKLENSIGVIAAHKYIKDEDGKLYALLAVFPRNAGYGAEWAGNFNIGKTGVHEGFLEARDEILRFTKQYIAKNHLKGEIKLWSAGYSRGAAAANLFGGYLADNPAYLGSKVTLPSSNIFVYTIGTPRVIPSGLNKSDVLNVAGARGEGYLDTEVASYTYTGEQGTINPEADQYKCVHNFIAVGDYITKLPPASWGFTRYGQSEQVLYGSPEMLTYLDVLSHETAEKFEDGKNYATEISKKSFDLEKLEVVELNEKISPDSLIEERLNALMNLAGSRADLVDQHYAEVLGAVTSIFGLDYSGYSNIMSDDLGSVAGALLSNYMTYAAEKLNAATDEEGVAHVLMDIMELAGKKITDRATYSDQQFLADFLDYLINDSVAGEENAVARSEKIASLIPEPINEVYTGLLAYAKEKALAPHTVDELVYLLASYITDNKTNLNVMMLVMLLATQIPADTVNLLANFTGKEYPEDMDPTTKAFTVVVDLMDCCVNGMGEGEGHISADAYRGTLFMAAGFALMSTPNLVKLIMNGSHDTEGNLVNYDPVPLSVLAKDILTLALPKDESGKQLTLKETADKTLSDLLAKGRSEKNGKYVDYLMEHPSEVRDILVTVLFNPGEEYSLSNDITNAYTFIDTIQFLFPAHNHEMYVCYLKTKVIVNQ